MNVVTNPRRDVLEAIDREQQASFGVALDQRVERIVLKDHRQRFAPEEIVAERRVRGDRLAQRDRETRSRPPRLISRSDAPIARDGLAKTVIERGAQRLRHSLAADDGAHVVLLPVDVARYRRRPLRNGGYPVIT